MKILARFLAALALLVPLLAPAPSEAQYNPTRGNNLRYAKFNRIVYVDGSGRQGDFRTVRQACDWVATQTRSLDKQWAILVYPGTYEEEPFTIPDRTVVRGLQASGAPTGNAPIITNGTLAGGTWITLKGHLSDIVVRYHYATLTAPATAIAASGYYAALYDTQVQVNPSSATHAVTGLLVPADSFAYVVRSQFTVGNDGTNMTLVKITGNGFLEMRDSILTGGAWGALRGLQHSGSGVAYLWNTYFGGALGGGVALTTDIVNDGAGSVRTFDTSYATATGTVTPTGFLHATGSTPATAATACSAGTVTWDASFIYICTASGAWKRAAIATW